MGLCNKIEIFVDTNLGTHFALSVPQDITAGDLKGKLGMEHFSCFPHLGKIKVHGLMVKKKSFLYHLSDSMAIKYVFKKSSGPFLLCLDATSLQNALEDRSSTPYKLKPTLSNSSTNGDQSQKPVSYNQDKEYTWTKNREVKSTCGSSYNTERQFNHGCDEAIQKDRSTISDYPIEEKVLENSRKSNQTISVSGIISRFFSESDEVDSCCFQPSEMRNLNIRTLKSQPDQMSNRNSVVYEADIQCSFAKEEEGSTIGRGKAALKVKKQRLGSKRQFKQTSLPCTSQISSRMYIETLSNKSCTHKVGKRLVQAANNIQVSLSEKRSAMKFLTKFKNLTCPDSGSHVSRRIVFDVEDFND